MLPLCSDGLEVDTIWVKPKVACILTNMRSDMDRSYVTKKKTPFAVHAHVSHYIIPF